jgi:hypothetical protein
VIFQQHSGDGFIICWPFPMKLLEKSYAKLQDNSNYSKSKFNGFPKFKSLINFTHFPKNPKQELKNFNLKILMKYIIYFSANHAPLKLLKLCFYEPFYSFNFKKVFWSLLFLTGGIYLVAFNFWGCLMR